MNSLTSTLACLLIASPLLAEPPKGADWNPIHQLTDEFNGDKLNPRKWHDHNPGWNGRKPGFFSKGNVKVRDGKLHLTARAESLKDLPEGYHTFTTAAVKSKTLVKYGYFEIRCRPMKSRASSAFWFYRSEKDLWTEIDVFEICGAGEKKNSTYHMNAHVFRTPEEDKHWSKPEIWNAPFVFAEAYHVYALEWDENMIRWWVDGKMVREMRNTHWHQPLHMNFDSETFPSWFGLPEKKNLPSTFSIDYVRSWKKADHGVE